MNNWAFEIKIDDLKGSETASFLSRHLDALAQVSPPESRHALDLNGLRQPDVTFWGVRCGHELVGCGALKELDPEHGEIKSMRTAEAHLRKGIASMILDHIVWEAKRRGYRRLSLETGSMDYFKPAHNLYLKFGFAMCPPFANYLPDANSVFMTREL